MALLVAVYDEYMLSHLVYWMIKNSIPGTQKLFTMVRDSESTIRSSVSVNGQKIFLELCPCDYLDRQVIQQGYYEQHVLDELLTTPHNGTLWDIGANVGLHSAATAALRSDLRITSIEANPLLIRRLLANVSGYANVTVVSCGLSGDYSILPFSLNSSGNSGHSSFTPWEEVIYQRVVSLPAIPASALGNAPNTVKLDVEGHELEVLRGFGNLLSCVDKFVIETKYPQEVHQVLGRSFFGIRQIGDAHKGDYVYERLTQ